MQGDGISCDPIACLKVIEIYGFLPVGSIERIGEFQHGYRHVVMDYYNECISRYNDNLKVEFRQNMFLHAKQPNSGRNELIARTS